MEDLAHFTPGDHFSIFEINGIKCSCLICHEFRYPELYRELKKAGVQIVFHSYHAGNMLGERLGFMESQVGEALFEFNPGRTIPEITMPSTMISYAANNYLWISCSNTSARQSCWASFVVRPDGVIKGKMEKNKAGILITEIDTNISFYDSTKAWRKRAMKGQYNSGELVRDTRSVNRNIL
jgi:predicted amidohydrolase